MEWISTEMGAVTTDFVVKGSRFSRAENSTLCERLQAPRPETQFRRGILAMRPLRPAVSMLFGRRKSHGERNHAAQCQGRTHQQQTSLELPARCVYDTDDIWTNETAQISDRVDEGNPGRCCGARQDAGRHRPEWAHHREHSQHCNADGKNCRADRSRVCR